jgi:hypothetical protein
MWIRKLFLYLYFLAGYSMLATPLLKSPNLFLRDVWIRNPESCRSKQEPYQHSHLSPSLRNLAYLFRKYEYDSLKIEHHAHGAKTSDPVINKENNCYQANENQHLCTDIYFSYSLLHTEAKFNLSKYM